MSKQKYPQTSTGNVTGGASRSTVRKTYSHAFLDAKNARKRAEAEERNAVYARLSTAKKIASIPVGGGKRQRARLEAQQATEKAAAVKTPPLTTEQKGEKIVKRAKASAKQHDKVGGTVTM